MKKIGYWILGVSLLVITFNTNKIRLIYKYYLTPCYHDFPIKQYDFPQLFLTIDLKQYYQNLITLATPHFKVDTLEIINYKHKKYPILGLTPKVTPKNNSKNKLLIIAGVHGNESSGILALLELLKQYNTHPAFFKNWELKIVSPINPVGTLEMSRYNKYGCDLNRKIASSQQKEIVLQRNIIDTFKPHVIISFHEAPSSGFLIHSNKLLPKKLLNQLLAEVKEKGITLATTDYFGRKLETPGNSKINGFFKIFKNIVEVQDLENYITPKGIIEITTESGWNSNDHFQRIYGHVFTVLSIVNQHSCCD